MVERINQVRGTSVFASVITRLEDLKDYEESERIAAKVAASMAAYIKKGSPDTYSIATDENGDPIMREMKFVPGMVFDNLMEGEDIGTIDTTRPNAQLEPHRKGQLRAAASGLGITYSSMAKDYNGTYSSQRQELVEGWGVYGVLASEFVGSFVRPVYEQFIDAARLSGAIEMPSGVDELTLKDAMYMPPQMPWIDPQKEARAWGELESNGHASGPEIIRRRGQKPRDLLDQEARWRKEAEDRGLKFDTNTNEEETDDAEEEGESQRNSAVV
jgi:lambda family phage portal protein